VILPGSYANGFAPRDNQPLYPELWHGCVSAVAPCLGPTGLTVRDWGAKKQPATLTNCDPSVVWKVGDGKYCFGGDGTNDYIALGDFGALPSKGMISFWAYTTSIGFFLNMFGTNAFSSNSKGFRFEVANSSGVVSAVVGDDTGVFPSSASSIGIGTIPLSKWTHFALKWSVTDSLLVSYFNGAQFATSSHSFWVANLTDVRLGQGFSSTRCWAGLLDDCRIYFGEVPASVPRRLASRRGIAYELAPRRRSRAAVITSGFSALRPSILRGSR